MTPSMNFYLLYGALCYFVNSKSPVLPYKNGLSSAQKDIFHALL